jgi:hypothetical protein
MLKLLPRSHTECHPAGGRGNGAERSLQVAMDRTRTTTAKLRWQSCALSEAWVPGARQWLQIWRPEWLGDSARSLLIWASNSLRAP